MSSRRPLFEACLEVLQTGEAEKKAALACALAEDWRAGRLSLELEDDASLCVTDPSSRVPASPARPAGVAEVDPRKSKGGSKAKFAFHALVHAESYAIDLAIDVMARFGWSPASWTLPAAVGGAVGTDVLVRPGAPSTHPASEPEAGGSGGTAGVAHLPRAFFDDWVAVAEEEAQHMTRWLGRLRAVGADYGSFPAHNSLWESARETAYGLGARLAVVHCVHEARGLDTYPAFLSRLEAAGDVESATVLRTNVAQEVEHVAKGRRWLQWLADAAGRGDDAPALYQTLARRHFRGLLKPPFNEADRDAAGLTSSWWGPLAVAIHTSGEGPTAAPEEAPAPDAGQD